MLASSCLILCLASWPACTLAVCLSTPCAINRWKIWLDKRSSLLALVWSKVWRSVFLISAATPCWAWRTLPVDLSSSKNFFLSLAPACGINPLSLWLALTRDSSRALSSAGPDVNKVSANCLLASCRALLVSASSINASITSWVDSAKTSKAFLLLFILLVSLSISSIRRFLSSWSVDLSNCFLNPAIRADPAKILPPIRFGSAVPARAKASLRPLAAIEDGVTEDSLVMIWLILLLFDSCCLIPAYLSSWAFASRAAAWLRFDAKLFKALFNWSLIVVAVSLAAFVVFSSASFNFSVPLSIIFCLCIS